MTFVDLFKLAFLVLLFYTFPLLSDTLLIPQDGFYQLNSYGEFFLDEKKDLTIEYISKNKHTLPFEPIKVKNINFGITSSDLWLYFPLKGSELEDLTRIIEIQPPFIDKLELFQLVDGKIFNKQISGDRYKGSGRLIKNRNLLFEIVLPRSKNSHIYLKINSKNHLMATVFLWEIHKKIGEIPNEDTTVYIFYGLILIMISYNFFLFFAFRDVSFFYFIFYAIFSGLNQMCIDGTISMISDSPIMNNHLHILSTVLIVSFGILFFSRFLKIKELFPLWHRTITYFLIINIAFGFYVLFGDILITDNLANLSAVMVNFIVFPLSIAVIRRGYSPAWYYFSGYLFVLVSFILYMLKIYNIYPDISINILKYGFGIEMCLFSLGLSEKIGIIRNEKEKAQKEIIELQAFAKVSLEKEVINRTRELNSILKEMKRDLNVAKKIQENLLPQKIHETKNIFIDSIYLPFSEIGGDVFHIQKFSENKFRIFIGDATGHGVQAALFTMLIIGEYEVRKSEKYSPAEVLKKLNDRFTSTYKGLNAFFTACILDVDTDINQITFSSAGHPLQLYFKHKEKKLIGLSTKGRMIGLSSESNYVDEIRKISAGDKILLFTDGAFEEFNSTGKQFGEFQLYKKFKQFSMNVNEKNLIPEIISRLKNHLKEQKFQDDITMVSIYLKKSD